MKGSILLSISIGIIMSGCLRAEPLADDADMNVFIEHLMSRMTLEEKNGKYPQS